VDHAREKKPNDDSKASKMPTIPHLGTLQAVCQLAGAARKASIVQPFTAAPHLHLPQAGSTDTMAADPFSFGSTHDDRATVREKTPASMNGILLALPFGPCLLLHAGDVRLYVGLVLRQRSVSKLSAPQPLMVWQVGMELDPYLSCPGG
jgi:hypothetical protein